MTECGLLGLFPAMAKNFKLELTQRPRRLRRQPSRRALVAETVLRAEDLIAPLFVVDGKGGR